MRYLTAGESHGPQLTAIIEGVPSNLPISIEAINEQLARRQKGHGRGRRMQIEKDQVKIVSGVRHGYTTGAPITLVVENKDWTHWQGIMSAEPVEGAEEKRRVSRPRPGHADLNGAIKYHQRDMRNILERSSARETTVRVAVGAVARQLLAAFSSQTAAAGCFRIGAVFLYKAVYVVVPLHFGCSNRLWSTRRLGSYNRSGRPDWFIVVCICDVLDGGL